ncbi:MAG: HPr family phosphocarrier protein [Candidatus Pacearchaeota archaeon]
MEIIINKFKELFKIDSIETTEIDIDNTPLTNNVKKELLDNCKQSMGKIKAYFKILKNMDDSYTFEGALVYRDNGKNKILYLNQNFRRPPVQGTIISHMMPNEELSWHEYADSYKEMALKLEKYLFPNESKNNENGYDRIFIEIKNRFGLHARAAGLFVKEATKYNSEIYVRNGRETAFASKEIDGKNYVDGKSIMSLLTLAAEKGSILEIIVKGDDSKKAIEGLTNLINNKFYED